MNMNSTADFERIYQDFREPLKAFIARRVSDPAFTEDLLHDVFLRIHNQIGTLNEPDKLPAWIYQIARNSIIDSYRKKRETVNASDDLVAFEHKEVNDASLDLVRVVRSMVEKLPVQYKEALLLADFQGMKQAELARRLKISLSGAKSRVQRARKLLKGLLLECCHFEFDRYGTVFDYYPKKCVRCCSDESCK
jgi:RNA polymerase sigma-70 factor (ECF subfamily)